MIIYGSTHCTSDKNSINIDHSYLAYSINDIFFSFATPNSFLIRIPSSLLSLRDSLFKLIIHTIVHSSILLVFNHNVQNVIIILLVSFKLITSLEFAKTCNARHETQIFLKREKKKCTSTLGGDG